MAIVTAEDSNTIPKQKDYNPSCKNKITNSDWDYAINKVKYSTTTNKCTFTFKLNDDLITVNWEPLVVEESEYTNITNVDKLVKRFTCN